MIDVHTEGNSTMVKMTGDNAATVIAECIGSIRAMYFSMEQKERAMGMFFRHTIEMEIKRGRLFKRYGSEQEVDLSVEGMADTENLVEDALKDFPEE